MWEYEKATKKDNEITVTLKRPYKDKEGKDQVERKELTWGYTKDMGTVSQFKEIIKWEVKNVLDHLNKTETETDITAEIKV